MPGPAPHASVEVQELPLKMVGGVHYGRYPKISDEQTWNFIISDGFLVPYAGYKVVINNYEPNTIKSGRGLYSSFRANVMYTVIDNQLYQVNPDLSVIAIFEGELLTTTGDVYMAENNGGQICITDGVAVYIYNYNTGSFTTLPYGSGSGKFPFQNPGYVSFQNGYFLIASQGTTNWAISAANDGTMWSVEPDSVGSLQTKPDYVQAAVPVPGGGNNLLVFGRNCCELWQYTGQTTFPYQRASTFNSDFGCINPATIASLNNVIVWIGVNEQTGPMLMTFDKAGNVNQISTDGIDYKLGNLSNPTNCTGFLYQQDGHLLYQFTFVTDNISYAYDFNTKEFFSVSDENMDYHIARQVVYFNNTYFFVSLNDGNLYQFDTIYSTGNDSQGNTVVIPRIRITPPIRLPTQRWFIINNVQFTIEQGQPNQTSFTIVEENTEVPITTESGLLLTTEDGTDICEETTPTGTEIAQYTASQNIVYLSVSRDGGMNFGTQVPLNMNPTGLYKSRFIYQRLGMANDATFQFRFYGDNRFVLTDGQCEVYQ